jgi:beta-lactamase regulating signal transducer with metallopeptidase domain
MTATQTLGWALVHSVWQGALAATALALLLAILPSRIARFRYALATATLVLMLALPVATALRLHDAPPSTAVWVAAGSAAAPERASFRPAARASEPPYAHPRPARAVAPPLVEQVRDALERSLPWVVALWLGGVLVFSIRLASGWLTARRLWTVGTRPAPPACAEQFARLVARLRIRRPVRVLESAAVQVPAVIGWLRPVVLLPASALMGLSPLQLDALLAHELAHVRRYDYLVNLLQSVIETLLFYHPGVWWVGRRVREEREHCCDDLAVAVCGDPHFYATALLGMEGLRGPRPAFALAADGTSLLSRIRRLIGPRRPEIFPRWIAGPVAVSLALTISGAAGLGRATPVIREVTVWTAPGFASDAAGHPILTSTDTLIARARMLRNAGARREAVEQLGEQGDRRALGALIEIARDDHNKGVQKEAVEALGNLRDARAFPSLVAYARNHAVPDVRREAVEALGKLDGPETLTAALARLALEGSDTELQREAVEALGQRNDPAALELLAHVARFHARAEVRRKAIDQYAEAAAPDAALSFLRVALTNDRSPEAQQEALEELADLPDGVGIPVLMDAARSHPSRAIRAQAWREVDDR